MHGLTQGNPCKDVAWGSTRTLWCGKVLICRCGYALAAGKVTMSPLIVVVSCSFANRNFRTISAGKNTHPNIQKARPCLHLLHISSGTQKGPTGYSVSRHLCPKSLHQKLFFIVRHSVSVFRAKRVGVNVFLAKTEKRFRFTHNSQYLFVDMIREIF